ncbi:MAG TPA: HIT domain-containing protein [Propionibacteriaceae bacterium]|nr:HIT domain-containing protein [Propionibacteriaceae bacterium]
MSEPVHGTEDADLFAGVPDAFQRLWTPHRMAYIGGESKPGSQDEPDCPFCRAPRHSDERGLIVARGELAYVVMNLYPYSPGHLLVCPYRHVAGYIDATTAEVDEVARLTRIAIRALGRVSHPQGFNIGMNQGAVGGAGIQAHLHQHVVPRWLGDTNFLPIVAQTRAVPQLLSAGRELLAEAWGVATDEEDEKERHA